MVHFKDIHSLTGFLRDHKAYIKRLGETGRPEVLTVNGEAKVVVQDAAAYQRLVDMIEAVETEHVVRERLAAIERGEPGVGADEVLSAVRKRLGLGE